MTIVTRDAEYTPEDLALLLASRRKDAEVGPHGFPMSEATDPANESAFTGPRKPRVDFALKAQKDAMDQYYKVWPDANRNGHLWGVTRKST